MKIKEKMSVMWKSKNENLKSATLVKTKERR